jgi:uncharacterized protein (DUF885 family)
MHTFLIILAVLAVLFFAAVLWVRSKIRRGVAWVKVTVLEKGVEELRLKVAAPDADPELAPLLERAEAALTKAKAANTNGDVRGVSEAADPILKELLERVAAQAEKEATAKDGIVIDVTPTEPKAPLSLPAPERTAPSSCAAPVDAPKPVDPTADTK